MLHPCCLIAVTEALRARLERQATLDRQTGRPATLARHTDAGQRKIAAAVARLLQERSR
jgi:hypothetical protein